MTKWLIIDTTYLAYRSFYSLGDLSYKGISTGVVYGIMKTVLDLIDTFGTSNLVWTFDGGYNKRIEICETYKGNRSLEDKSPEEIEAQKSLKEQIKRMYQEYLPEIGFSNLFRQFGYEADDVIASVCHHLTKDDTAIIVSADNDLYQLLTSRISIWQFNRGMMTIDKFKSEFGVSAFQWADVKAIAGCSSDNVIGLKGIGEKTAAKFLAGKLNSSTKAFNTIVYGNSVWRNNLPLVRLPFEGTNTFALHKDDKLAWDNIWDKLGMKSLMDRGRRTTLDYKANKEKGFGLC